ncbi:DUF3303 domain-containing protein, partial [Chloroflexota bacterium]
GRMLYMNILTWDPEKRDEVLKRAKQTGFKHEGIKVIGTWSDIDGGRAFQLTETPTDPKIGLKANFAWNDIMKIETVAVMDAEEMVKLLASMK